MTGLSSLTVELDDAAGSGAWRYDITDWVDLRAGWSLTRGRQDELGEIDPSQLRLRLNNRDGRFTVGSAAYGIVVDHRIRLTERFDGVTAPRRFTGFVQDWPVSFADAGARNVPCDITAVDRQSRLARRKLVPALAATQRADSPTYLYSLAEPAGSTTAGDTSGNAYPALRTAGTGAAVVFGTVVTGPDQTGAAFAAGKYLLRALPLVLSQTYEAVVVASSAPAAAEEYVRWEGDSVDQGGLSIRFLSSGAINVQATPPGGAPLISLTTPGVLADGLPHLVTVRWTTTTVSLYVDGLPVDSATPLAVAAAFSVLRVGSGVHGVVLGIAVYGQVLTNARVSAHATQVAATFTESSDARIARLAAYGNVPTLALESGVEREVANQTLAGASLLSAMQDVVTTEGGVLFFDGRDRLVMQNRQHRVLAATGAPVVALASEDVEHDDLVITTDKQYLRNEVTGTDVNGGVQTARNDASLVMFEQYPADLSLLVTSETKVADRIAWEVGAYAQPLPRLNRVTIDLLTLTDPAKVRALLALELGDRITISGLPSQSPIATADLIVEGFEERQSADEWRLTLNTVSAALFRAWVLGDPTYGVLGSTTRLHY